MPAKSKGPRLYYYERPGRTGQWLIRDGSRQVFTGCAYEARRDAEKALADYIAGKHKPEIDGRSTKIGDVLLIYTEHKTAEPIPTHLKALVPFWATKTLGEVSAATCAAYVAQRVRKVKPATARRELETLNAAIRFCARERGTPIVLLTFPQKSVPRERWLSRQEAARLLAGALGFLYVPACDVATRREAGRFVRIARPSRHVARFILLGLYTGTRHGALLKLNWNAGIAGGWIDLQHGVIYRKAVGERETRKRKPPLRIPTRLIPHLQRWRRLDRGAGPVISYHGEPILKEKTGFARARDRAGLGPDVVVHTLRHTCATWLMQSGQVPIWEAAGFLGMSEKMVDSVYGHQSPEFHSAAAAAFSRKK